jgi:excisionase family DNA binding protein
MTIPAELQGRATTSVEVAGKVLGIGRRQAYAAVNAGEMPSLRMGGRILVPVAPLLKMLGIE